MGRVVTFKFSAAGTMIWTCDIDSEIVAFSSTTTAALSRNVADTSATIFNPTTNSVDNNLVSAVSANKMQIIPNIPVYAAEQVLVVISAQGNAQLFLVDMVH